MKLVLENNIGTCPICGDDMESSHADHIGGEYYDYYHCWACNIAATYISPDDDRGEYSEYRNGEIKIELETLPPFLRE